MTREAFRSAAGRCLLVTGGTGSFGSTVVRRFLDSEVAEIRVYSRDEKKQDDMRREFRDDRIRYYLGDVRDETTLSLALRGVDFVFHAAALKQVPSCEFHPMEAVQTNVVGTRNVLAAAERNGVERIVCLSTDKAVYPINAMGISKAMMEKVMVAQSREAEGTTMVATRYGNVMASRGSVIPLFLRQIREGLPLTVTNPDMTRFMMSLEDSVDLVLFAFEHGEPGEIFVQKSPATTIGTLGRALLELFESPVPVEIIGTRHGEKLFETLLTREERLRSEELDRYFRILPDVRDLNYSKFVTEGDAGVESQDDYTSHNTTRLDLEEMKRLLGGLPAVRAALEERGP